MTTILCATRGGEASIRTQRKAIALAKERGATLLFVYVADVSFMDGMADNILADVQTELENMGEFLLLMAKERAEQEGVTAATAVKRGEFRTALIETAMEFDTSAIVFGSPGEGGHTQSAYLEALTKGITEETGIEAIIVDHD